MNKKTKDKIFGYSILLGMFGVIFVAIPFLSGATLQEAISYPIGILLVTAILIIPMILILTGLKKGHGWQFEAVWILAILSGLFIAICLLDFIVEGIIKLNRTHPNYVLTLIGCVAILSFIIYQHYQKPKKHDNSGSK